ncbi:hypothetical protein ACWCXH_18275 [Kitasatospora sp. NPDC001660]
MGEATGPASPPWPPPRPHRAVRHARTAAAHRIQRAELVDGVLVPTCARTGAEATARAVPEGTEPGFLSAGDERIRSARRAGTLGRGLWTLTAAEA